MYIWRAYQSPYSVADCGPQCAQMPNLASRNQEGTRYALSDSRVPLNGPDCIGGTASPVAKARAPFRAGTAAASNLRRVRLVMDIRDSPLKPKLNPPAP